MKFTLHFIQASRISAPVGLHCQVVLKTWIDTVDPPVRWFQKSGKSPKLRVDWINQSLLFTGFFNRYPQVPSGAGFLLLTALL